MTTDQLTKLEKLAAWHAKRAEASRMRAELATHESEHEDAAKAVRYQAFHLESCDILRAAAKALRQKASGAKFGAPKSDAALRIAALFQRRPETAWSVKEVAAFVAIGEINPGDLSLIETYYAQERAKGNGDDGGCHRRDLGTFRRGVRRSRHRCEPRCLPVALKHGAAPC